MKAVVALFDDDMGVQRAQERLTEAGYGDAIERVLDHSSAVAAGDDAGGTADSGATAGAAVPGAPAPGTAIPGTQAGNVIPQVGAWSSPTGQRPAGGAAATGFGRVIGDLGLDEDTTYYLENAVADGSRAIILRTDDPEGVVRTLEALGAGRVVHG